MSNQEIFLSDYEGWRKRCLDLGLRGPFTLVGNPPGEQFIHPEGDSAALWNGRDRRGVVLPGAVARCQRP
jgi:hypothetical protein